MKRGWKCIRPGHPVHNPCALVPRWWNVMGHLHYYLGVSFVDKENQK